MNCVMSRVPRTRTPVTAVCSAALLMLLAIDLAGCGAARQRIASLGRRPQAIPLDASVEAICEHLNADNGQCGGKNLRSWESDHVQITGTGLPMKVPATIAVKAPRDLRLRINHPITGSDQADLGSNDEQFWAWAEDGGPKLYTSDHEHSHLVAKMFHIPIEPDWVIDVLGVNPIDPSKVERNPTQSEHVVELSQPYRLPNGHAGKRVAIVDLRKGKIIGHELRLRGRTVAQARITEWTRCEDSGLDVPARIRMHWPQRDMAITLAVSDAKANPERLSPHLFRMPQRRGVEICDLCRHGLPSNPFASPAETATAASDRVFGKPEPFGQSTTIGQSTKLAATLAETATPQPFKPNGQMAAIRRDQIADHQSARNPLADFQPFDDEQPIGVSRAYQPVGHRAAPTPPGAFDPSGDDWMQIGTPVSTTGDDGSGVARTGRPLPSDDFTPPSAFAPAPPPEAAATTRGGSPGGPVGTNPWDHDEETGRVFLDSF